jgi:hypothetical protein
MNARPGKSSAATTHTVYIRFAPLFCDGEGAWAQCAQRGSFAGQHSGLSPPAAGGRIPSERFATVVRDGEEHSILRRYYVSPWVRSILQVNEIDGLMRDTTWHVLWRYVTAIIISLPDNRFLIICHRHIRSDADQRGSIGGRNGG